MISADSQPRFAPAHAGVAVAMPGAQGSQPVALRPWISRWRVAALIAVHLLIVAHVLHWWITGRSLGRFVLSDTMQTLELGEINPGAILFALAILTTALFGRFLCGWMCHIGALQDFAAWLFRKMGVRPRLFRSRLLGFVPLGLALYMFLWPTFKRELLVPALAPVWPQAASKLAVAPFPGFSLNLTSDRLWDGLPSLWVAIPFLLIAGCLIIYFLGARGLCRYSCPYGGILFSAEKLAPGRVTVDRQRCDQCGLCSAACTAEVRVHDEIRIHGSVTDRNCIRSLDCVAACPQKALSFSAGRPAIFARRGSGEKPVVRYDLSWSEEILCIAVFLATFFTLRGLYHDIPLLMAVPLAVIAAYLSWKTLRLWRDENLVLAGMQFRGGRRLTGSGRVFFAAMALIATLLVHSAAVRLLIWRAGHFDDRVTVSYDAALAQQGVSDSDRRNAAAGLRLYRLANSFRREGQHGIGLAFTPEVSVRISWLEIVSGRPQAALDELDALRRAGLAGDGTVASLAATLCRQGQQDRARDTLRETLCEQPGFTRCRDLQASLLMQAGRMADAEQLYQERLASRPTDALARAGMARVLFAGGRRPEALTQLEEASREAPREPAVARDHALALHALGRADDAVAELKRGAAARPAARAGLFALAAQVLRESGREVEARELDPALHP